MVALTKIAYDNNVINIRNKILTLTTAADWLVEHLQCSFNTDS